MKQTGTMFGLFLAVGLFLGASAFAHPVDDTVIDMDMDMADDYSEDCSVSCEYAGPQVDQTTTGAWGQLGIVAGLIALVNLLMQILRLRQLDTWLRDKKKLWLKPYISIALGTILGGLTAYQTGIGIFQSVIAGLLSGVAAVGLHESINKRRPEKRLK